MNAETSVEHSGDEELLLVTARRCKRCGGLLTSAAGIARGYGSCCLQKARREAWEREVLREQCSIFAEDA